MNTKNSVDPEVILREWRSRILNIFLAIVAVISAGMTVATILDAMSSPGLWPAIPLYVILTFVVAGLAIFRHINYHLRAWGLLSQCYIGGLATLDITELRDFGWSCSTFAGCTNLVGLTFCDSLKTIGDMAFCGCTSLTDIIIPSSVTSIGDGAFSGCYGLTGVYFEGNAPDLHYTGGGLSGDTNAIVYYLPGTMGWEPTFDGRPTAPWVLSNPIILTTAPNFGTQSKGFSFVISWATNVSVVVEACTTLANPTWILVNTNALTDGWDLEMSHQRSSDIVLGG